MTHGDHEWARELVPVHLTGGLATDEQSRFDDHAENCAECIADIESLRRFDASMQDVFAPARPKAGLEERVIRSLRTHDRRSLRPWILSAAALLLFGLLGYVMEHGPMGMGDGATYASGVSAESDGYLDLTRAKMRADSGLKDAENGMFAWTSVEGAGIGGGGEVANAEQLARSLEGRLQDGRHWYYRGQAASADKDLSGGNVVVWNGVGPVVDIAGATENPITLGLAVKGLESTGAGDTLGTLPTAGEMAHSRSLSFDSGRVQDEGQSVDRLSREDMNGTLVTGGIVMERGKQAEWKKARAVPEEELRRELGEATPGLATVTDSDTSPSGGNARDVTVFYGFLNEGTSKGPDYFKPAFGLAAATEVDRKHATRGTQAQPVATGAVLPQDAKPGQGQPKQPKADAPAVTARKIIKSGQMEFEIESFDSTVALVHKIADEEGGHITTVNSEKLPNGKVRGSVVVRCPPERLTTLILKLRGIGELKSQRIGSQDVTKQYTDLESRLRAARAMEDRLIEIIKKGGEVKDLLAAEKELGNWRTKIETIEGEIRYYNNLISMSTLTVTLYEKEIRSAHGATETERVLMGIEVEDVEKAHKEALAAVEEAEGRVTKSELKQHAAGQFNAILHVEVKREAAGPLRDRLKQLGHVARLDIERAQKSEGGSGPSATGRVTRKDTEFQVSIYNLANVAPRETVQLNLACTDAEAVYKAILDRVTKAKGRVVTSSLNRQKNDRTTGTLRFEVPEAEADTVLADVRVEGEVMLLKTIENPDAQNVTKSKRGFQVQVLALGVVQPRETSTLQIAVRDVPMAYKAILAAVREAGGRVFTAQLNERDRHNVSGSLEFEVLRDKLAAVDAALGVAGDIYSRTSTRAQDSETVVDTKTRYNVTVLNLAAIPPRESYTVAVEVRDVDAAMATFGEWVAGVEGRTKDSRVSRQRNGRNVGKVVVDIPLNEAKRFATRFRDLGEVRVFEASRNPSVPDSELAVARLDVLVSNADPIVTRDSGFGAQARKGLTWLMGSLGYVVLGLCVAGPWLVLAALAWWWVQRRRRTRAAATPAG